MVPSKISKPLVLLAEDNPVVRKGVENFLAKWGYKAISADNGDKAWELLEENPAIRLAIIDWNLPGISGIQLCQRLRTRTGPYVYAIMFSSRKSHEEKLMALDGGADDFLVKPCKPSDLRARLGVGRRIIDNALSLRESAPSNPAPETDDSVPAPEDDDKKTTAKE